MMASVYRTPIADAHELRQRIEQAWADLPLVQVRRACHTVKKRFRRVANGDGTTIIAY